MIRGISLFPWCATGLRRAFARCLATGVSSYSVCPGRWRIARAKDHDHHVRNASAPSLHSASRDRRRTGSGLPHVRSDDHGERPVAAERPGKGAILLGRPRQARHRGHRDCSQVPDARLRRGGSWAGRSPSFGRTVHGLRADRRGLRGTSGRHTRVTAASREQGEAARHHRPPRGARPAPLDGGRQHRGPADGSHRGGRPRDDRRGPQGLPFRGGRGRATRHSLWQRRDPHHRSGGSAEARPLGGFDGHGHEGSDVGRPARCIAQGPGRALLDLHRRR